MTEIVHDLVQYVTRAFYDTKQIIVMDAVLKHSALRDDHLASMLGLQVKELHKVCGPLREDRIVSTGSKVDPKASTFQGDRRGFGRVYYYVDYQVAVDAIKWRTHKLVRTVEDKMKKDSVAQGYVCPCCRHKYSSLDVNMLISADGTYFQCANCGAALHSDQESAESIDSRERLGRLMNQISKLIDALQAVDEVKVSASTFSTALANATLPQDAEFAAEYDLPKSRSTISLPALPSSTLEVDFTSAAQDAGERERERERKLAMATQNALPIWHSESTIGMGPAAPSSAVSNGTKYPDTEGDVKPTPTSQAITSDPERAIAEYYRQLRKKQVDEASEDDEEEEFEDVEMAQSVMNSRSASVNEMSITGEASSKYSKENVKVDEEGSDEEDVVFEDF